MEAVARDQGLSRIKLSAQVPVIPFYERIGYRCFGDEFVEAGIPHRWMDRDL
jgi:predicted GNAT family N-acyltransferase